MVRKADLANVSNATLSYVYTHNGIGGAMAVQISPNAGNSWTTLRAYSLNEWTEDRAESFDISPYAGAETRIRFIVTQASQSSSDPAKIGIDNLQISFNRADSSCTVAQAQSANSGIFSDDFSNGTYGNHNGNLDWSSDWQEFGESNGPGYLELSGTSMAAGMVSGAAALMLANDPNITPATVKARLMRSAHKSAGDPTATGAGVLDVEAAAFC